MEVDKNSRVVAFEEKPKNPKPLVSDPDKALASMGIYVFNSQFLFEQLLRDVDDPKSSHDFGKDIIPHLIATKYRVFAQNFNSSCIKQTDGGRPYWRDVGTVDAYWEANMELTKVLPDLNMYDQDWPIWTFQEQLPPAKFVFNDADRRGMAVDSLVSGGCIISGASVMSSLLFSNVRLNSFSSVEDSVLLPGVEVGRNAVIKRAVIDKLCVIPEGMQIGVDLEVDRKRFYVSENGIVLVTPDMLGQKVHRVR
jgi:glucose-1-phosphate adenylyltransferase